MLHALIAYHPVAPAAAALKAAEVKGRCRTEMGLGEHPNHERGIRASQRYGAAATLSPLRGTALIVRFPFPTPRWIARYKVARFVYRVVVFLLATAALNGVLYGCVKLSQGIGWGY